MDEHSPEVDTLIDRMNAIREYLLTEAYMHDYSLFCDMIVSDAMVKLFDN